MVQNIFDEVQEWTKQTHKTVQFVYKGMNCYTEFYSAIEAEVPIDTDPETQRNHKLLAKLSECDRVSAGRTSALEWVIVGEHLVLDVSPVVKVNDHVE